MKPVFIFDLGKVLVDFDYTGAARKIAARSSRTPADLHAFLGASPLLIQYEAGQLSRRDADIVRYRYGLEDGSAHTLEETGRRCELTRERIRQIEKDVMRRLREFAGKNRQDYIHS